MELTEFISQSLMSIVEGVAAAQLKATNAGAHVNPTMLTRTVKNIGENAIWDNTNNNLARLVRFDVAVTVEEGTTTAGKIGVLAGIISLGSSGKSEDKNVAVSRIQFEVPVLLPGSPVKGARAKS